MKGWTGKKIPGLKDQPSKREKLGAWKWAIQVESASIGTIIGGKGVENKEGIFRGKKGWAGNFIASLKDRTSKREKLGA